MKASVLSSRQKELLRALLFASKPISYQQLSELFKLSPRTIRREIVSLKSILKNYHLEIVKKIGSGIFIDGTIEEKKKLEHDLMETKTFSVFSPEERQDGILYDLLMAKEPVKYFFFSDKYGVAETTISNDLEKLEPWCEAFGLKMVRKPGTGVWIEGPEHKKRMAISRLLHKDITFEEWFELFQLSQQEEYPTDKWQLESIVRKRLQKFIHPPHILIVEQAVQEVIESQNMIHLSDRNYVNLVVHLLLAVERIKCKEVNIEVHDFIPNIESVPEYMIAKQIVHKLEEKMNISIPEIEVSYITLHLLGSRSNGYSLSDYHIYSTDIEWVDLVKSFIRTVEKHLSTSLREDLILLDGLLSHLVPAISRLALGLQIHNPMLEEIQARYPQVFSACHKAARVLSDKIGKDIPEDEIGYLAIHIGASMIRINEKTKYIHKAIIVCASGMGTSTFLSSKIAKEIPNLKIEKVLSVTELKQWMQQNKSVDLIISTVALPFVDSHQYVIVSPFLYEGERKLIQQKLSGSLKKKKEDEEINSHFSSISAVSAAKYGEAMTQILRNTIIIHPITALNPILPTLVDYIKDLPFVHDEIQLLQAIERREKKGSFVLNGLAMIHTKSDGIKELGVVLFRLNGPIKWDGQDVSTFLLLAAPKEATKEHIEMISEISSNLIEEWFLEALINGTEKKVKEQMEKLLSQAYVLKVKAMVKEPGVQ
ncbi:PRD domain protein [Anoxybacillus sp. B7M1]|uniref:BglG family transcription antiterminator n=1 Tax=unclassified Anoxybacillus TaxID=2639704 RepID=UPI0005CCCAF8|nr:MULTISPECIES: BglG family transcription antiterminator [unclassified Anoxybacillus]ANB56301.1 PRD domain protein [Anoxybacillus sp. B2M1]ANB65819.1 PRD domain protein [Anoxybacillus sp. B7M1]